MPADRDPKRPSPTRIGIWVIVSAVAVYMIASGVVGIVGGG